MSFWFPNSITTCSGTVSMFLLGSSPVFPLFTLFSVWGQSEASCSSMLAFCHTHSTSWIRTWSVLGVFRSCPWRLSSWAAQIYRTFSIIPCLSLCQTQKNFFPLKLFSDVSFSRALNINWFPAGPSLVSPHILWKWVWRTLSNMTQNAKCSTTKQRSQNISPDLLGAVLIIYSNMRFILLQ